MRDSSGKWAEKFVAVKLAVEGKALYICGVGYASFPPQGAQMVIYCTYNKDNSSLVSRHRYVVAQNNNLSDKINIKCVGMTDPASHGYYIDFVCVTHGGAVKATYSSPSLEYGEDGLNFEIPNCLTRYEGYVEAQLVIFEKTRADVVTKSVGKVGGIFEVAASVNALETKVTEPANVLTELSAAVLTADNLNEELASETLKAHELNEQIEGVFNMVRDSLDEVVKEKILELAKVYPSAAVDFVFFGDRVISYTAVKGKLLPEPVISFPSDTVFSGWYCPAKGRHWNFDSDVVGEENVTLYADVRNAEGVSFENGVFTVSTQNIEKVYLPFTFDGQEVETVRFSAPVRPALTVYVNEKDYAFVNVIAKSYVVPYASVTFTGGSSLIRKKNAKLAGAHMSESGDLVVDLTVANGLDMTFEDITDIYQVVVRGDLCCSLSCVADGISSVCALAVEGNVVTHEFIGAFSNLQAILLLSGTPQKAVYPDFTTAFGSFGLYVPAQYMRVYAYNPEYNTTTVYQMEGYTGYDVSKIV